MEIEIANKETEEIYITGNSSLRHIPSKVIDKFFLRMFSLKCAYNHNDILKCSVANFIDDSIKLKDNWRLKIELQKYECIVKEIFELKPKSNDTTGN